MRSVHQPDFQLLFESAPGLLLVLLPDFTIVAASNAYLKATLTENEGIIGRGLFEVFPDNPDEIAPTGEANLRASLNYVLENRVTHTMAIQKYDIRKPDGSFEERHWSPVNKPVFNRNNEIIYIIHRAEDVTDLMRMEADRLKNKEETEQLQGLLAQREIEVYKRAREIQIINEDLIQEIAERKEAEKNLRNTKAILESSMESQKDVLLFSINPDYELLNFNNAFKEATRSAYGLDIESGSNILEIMTLADREKAKANFDRARGGESHTTIEEYGDRDRVFFETRYNPMVSVSGEIIGVTVLSANITDRMKSEESIRAINQELEIARQTAETANRTKGQFLANMSHEIRTPLNAIIGLSHLIQKTELSSKQADYMDKIQSSGESLLRIINDILDFSKIESGKLTLEEVSFDLEEIFQKLSNVITYKASAKGLEMAFGIDHRVPTYLVGDPVRLEQILSNLCSNAVKFTHEGEVVVRARLMDEQGENLQLQFDVLDTGIGMDEVQLKKLFVPFNQADDSISRKYGGTGLGLSIIKRLVELMEGKVWLESTPGKGSHFHFTVKLKKQTHQRKLPVPSIDLRKLSVLVVDDNRSSQKILKSALESFSFQVTVIDSGIQAVHYLKNNFHHQPVSLVLMDWKMPGMNGLEAAEIIRQDEQLEDVRIVMMDNGYVHEQLYQKIEELGLSGILTKPIRYSALYDTIIKAVENGRRKGTGNQGRGTEKKDGPYQGHLLLVEDNEINQQVATELLQGFGFTVDVASNGQEAVDTVSGSGQPSGYDLVLMDLQMPVMGGYAAAAEIRKMPQYFNLPVIAMTADALVGVKEKCLEVGMKDIITKPINPEKMLETIKRWLPAEIGVDRDSGAQSGKRN